MAAPRHTQRMGKPLKTARQLMHQSRFDSARGIEMFHAAHTIRQITTARITTSTHRTSRRAARETALARASVADPWHDHTPDAAGGGDLEAIHQLGDEIATLSAHIHAATYRLLELIARFDRRSGWEVDGQRSCAHWLALRTGIDLGAAREKVRAARALAQSTQQATPSFTSATQSRHDTQRAAAQRRADALGLIAERALAAAFAATDSRCTNQRHPRATLPGRAARRARGRQRTRPCREGRRHTRFS